MSAADLQCWWRTLGRVTGSEPVAGYLRGRCIDPMLCADLDLARVAVTRGGPEEVSHLCGCLRLPYLVVPLYDVGGTIRAVVGRSVARDPGIKSAGSRGTRSGLTMQDPMAGLMLSMATHGEMGLRGGWEGLDVVISEGEIDYLTWAATEPLEGSAGGTRQRACLGVVSGSWSWDLADRIPWDCTVIIRTDPDPAGDKLARRIAATLSGRRMLRPRRAA